MITNFKNLLRHGNPGGPPQANGESALDVTTYAPTYNGISYLVTANFGKWGWDDLSAHLMGLDEELAIKLKVEASSANPGLVAVKLDEGKYANEIAQRPKPPIQEEVITKMLDTYAPQWRNEYGLTVWTEAGIPPGKGVGSSAALAVATSQVGYSLLRHRHKIDLPREEQGYFATLGEALTTGGELIPDAVGAALYGGITGTGMDETSPNRIRITPYKTPSWNVLVIVAKGVSKIGGRTSGVRRKTARKTALMTDFPDYARNYVAVIRAIEQGDIDALAYVTRQMHPIEAERARNGVYGLKVTPEFIAGLDPELADRHVAVHRSNGPVTFLVYDPTRYQESEMAALALITEKYRDIGLGVDHYRTAITRGGTRDISPVI